MLALSLLVIIGHLSVTAATDCLTGLDNPGPMNEEANTMLTTAKFHFALDTLKEASTIESRDNLFFSPYSLFEALMLAYFGARGTTRTSLKEALRMPEELTQIDVFRSYSFSKWLKRHRESLVSIIDI